VASPARRLALTDDLINTWQAIKALPRRPEDHLVISTIWKTQPGPWNRRPDATVGP
jgi:hypothetical protein